MVRARSASRAGETVDMESLKRRSILKDSECSTPGTKTCVPSPRCNTSRKLISSFSEEESEEINEEEDVDYSFESLKSTRLYPCLKEMTERVAKQENLQKSSPEAESREFPACEPDLQNKNNNATPCYILICLFVVLFAVVLFRFLLPYQSSTIPAISTWDNPPTFSAINYTMLQDGMTSSLKKLRKEFPSSEVHLWKSSWACLYSILRDTPPQPGVLLLSPETEHALPTSQCIARKLAQVASDLLQRIRGAEVHNELTINAADFQDNFNAATFMELLKSRLARGLVVIQNVDLLPAKLAMTLHGLCDNENAPYKQAVIILLLSQPPPMGGRGLQDSFDRYLNKIWTQSKELKIDSVSSLVSRISNYAAIVGAEPRLNC